MWEHESHIHTIQAPFYFGFVYVLRMKTIYDYILCHSFTLCCKCVLVNLVTDRCYGQVWSDFVLAGYLGRLSYALMTSFLFFKFNVVPFCKL